MLEYNKIMCSVFTYVRCIKCPAACATFERKVWCKKSFYLKLLNVAKIKPDISKSEQHWRSAKLIEQLSHHLRTVLSSKLRGKTGVDGKNWMDLTWRTLSTIKVIDVMYIRNAF